MGRHQVQAGTLTMLNFNNTNFVIHDPLHSNIFLMIGTELRPVLYYLKNRIKENKLFSTKNFCNFKNIATLFRECKCFWTELIRSKVMSQNAYNHQHSEFFSRRLSFGRFIFFSKFHGKGGGTSGYLNKGKPSPDVDYLQNMFSAVRRFSMNTKISHAISEITSSLPPATAYNSWKTTFLSFKWKNKHTVLGLMHLEINGQNFSYSITPVSLKYHFQWKNFPKHNDLASVKENWRLNGDKKWTFLNLRPAEMLYIKICSQLKIHSYDGINQCRVKFLGLDSCHK